MAPLASSFTAAALLFAATARAHFLLNYPATVGFDDDLEGTAPCGGFSPDFSTDNVTDFYVDGDNIATNLLHAQGVWLYRATLDQTAEANNWTQLFPETLQTGLGKFCEPAIAVPASWAGQKGVISVVVDAPDGLLYQCAAVNFVSGAATANQSTCTNSSGVTASYTTDSSLASLAAGSDTAGNSSGTATATASASTSSSTKSAAAGKVGGSLPLGGAAGVVLAAMLGSAYMLL
jgi:hypothetical protein